MNEEKPQSATILKMVVGEDSHESIRNRQMYEQTAAFKSMDSNSPIKPQNVKKYQGMSINMNLYSDSKPTSTGTMSIVEKKYGKLPLLRSVNTHYNNKYWKKL